VPGTGTSPAITGDNTDQLDSSSRSAKVLAGWRTGNLSIEGAIGGNGIGQFNSTHSVFNPDYGTLYNVLRSAQAQPAARNNFEGFGQRRPPALDAADAEQTGSGHVRQRPADRWRLRVPAQPRIGAGSIFVDYTIGRTSLTGDQNDKLTRDMTTRTWMLGLTVGI